MSFKSLLTDLKTKVESNLQEALRPIDGLVSTGTSEPEADILRTRIRELTEEGKDLAQKLAWTEEKLREKSRIVDSLQPEMLQAEQALREKEISDLQLRLASLAQEFTTFRDEKDRQISDLRSVIRANEEEIASLKTKLKNPEISETRNFQASDWQLRYETALQAIGELEEKLEETEEEISVLREELRSRFS